MPTAKTAPLGFRVGPQLAYILKLAAKEQQMSVSSFVDQTLTDVLLRSTPDPEDEAEIAEGAPHINPRWDALWDEDEATRLYLLALIRPDLMEPNEARLWKLLGIRDGIPVKLHEFKAGWHDTAHIQTGGE